MKISTRISVLFSILSSVVLIVFGITVYALSKSHMEQDFTERLKNRVSITENFFLEKDSFTPTEFEKIKTQFSNTLPAENEEVIKINAPDTYSFKYEYSIALKKEMLDNTTFSFIENGRHGQSKIFTINGTKYLIIVTAVDEIGTQNLSYLLGRIILLTVIGVPILFILFFLITKRALLPISKKIKNANRISASNLDKRLEVINPKDEIGQMAIAFNLLLDRLEQSFNAQKSFIANASHEIKNPLTAIMGEAEIAASRDRTKEEYLDSFRIILSESERLNLTVNNLLQLSKVTANDFSISYSKIDYTDFIFQLIKSYGFVNPDNQLIFNPQKIQPIIIEGNSGLLKTALLNIFDNASKFSNNKKVEILISHSESECVLDIIDNGIGIPKEDLEKITEPFYRAKNTISVKGSGIGLSLTKKIIALHKGKMLIDSTEEKGTKVSIILPISI